MSVQTQDAVRELIAAGNVLLIYVGHETPGEIAARDAWQRALGRYEAAWWESIGPYDRPICGGGDDE
jgi:hypothetical protein